MKLGFMMVLCVLREHKCFFLLIKDQVVRLQESLQVYFCRIVKL